MFRLFKASYCQIPEVTLKTVSIMLRWIVLNASKRKQIRNLGTELPLLPHSQTWMCLVFSLHCRAGQNLARTEWQTFFFPSNWNITKAYTYTCTLSFIYQFTFCLMKLLWSSQLDSCNLPWPLKQAQLESICLGTKIEKGNWTQKELKRCWRQFKPQGVQWHFYW